jgi:CRP-like cAMP-binding protein
MARKNPAVDHRANLLLAALEPDDFSHIAPHLEFASLRQRQVLYEAGDTIHHAYFPHDTAISLVAVMEDGRSAEMLLCGREGVSGLVAAGVTRRSFGRYIVQMTGTASRISIDKMHEVMKTRPGTQRLVGHVTEATMTRVLQSVACNAVHSVEARCCRFILTIHHRVDHAPLPITHEFMAERLGVQRTTLSAVMRKLQKQGLIVQSRGGITVTDLSGLEGNACECYWRIGEIYKLLLPYGVTKP